MLEICMSILITGLIVMGTILTAYLIDMGGFCAFFGVTCAVVLFVIWAVAMYFIWSDF